MGTIQDFFLIAGILIIIVGLVAFVRPLAVLGTIHRRPAYSILAAGALALLGSTLAPPDVQAAAEVRTRLAGALDATQSARQQVVERWVEAQATLPGVKVPARFLRWNTTDPEFGTNLNLIPAAAFTEALTREEIVARASTLPLERLSENPLGHVGAVFKYSGKVLYVASLPLDSSIAQVLQRSDTSFQVIWVDVGNQRRLQFVMFNGPSDLVLGDPVEVYGYMLGLVSTESRTPVLFGKILDRK